MKIALAHDHLNQIGGAEKVLQTFHELYPSAPLYTLHYDLKLEEFFEEWEIHTSFIERLPGGQRFFKWYLGLMPAAVESFDLSAYDLVISSASAFIKGLVLKPHTTHICYCHTPTRYLWSDTHQYTAELPHSLFIKSALPVLLSRLRQWDYIAAQRVDYFVANSQFVADRIKKYYRREAYVIHPPTDIPNVKPSEPDDYFLIVSRLRPYKRTDLAVKAFNKLGIPLKVIGTGENLQELKAMAKPNIEFLGRVSDTEKYEYLRHARALIHPQEEDFGLTAVEALACGRPVIAYDAGGVREIIQDGVTGRLFADQTWEALADAVIRFRYDNFESGVLQAKALTFSRHNFEQRWKEFVTRVVK